MKSPETMPKKSKCEWLERYWIVGPYLCLCLNEKDYKGKLDEIKVSQKYREKFTANGADAQTHFYYKDGKSTACVITLLNWKKKSICSIFSLLAHEAMHVFQDKMKDINESDPGKEFEAYAIQSISLQLFCSFCEQTGRKELSKGS